MRYFLRLSYDGTDFRGWQRQDGVISVQQTLEEALQKVLKEPITLVGCGRTDAGVHANNYYAHLEINTELTVRLLRNLNYALPESIAVHEYLEAAPNWHARFAAYERKYIYRLHTSKDPFLARFSTYFSGDPTALDWSAMEAVTAVIAGTTEFRSLCKAPDRHKTTNCQVSSVKLLRPGSDRFEFHLSANRFLRGMIRIIVAQLLDVGQGKLSVDTFEQRLVAQERVPYFHLAPPQGLCLAAIRYPFIEDN